MMYGNHSHYYYSCSLRLRFFRSFRVRLQGTGRNRTALDGFAVRCITTLPPRQIKMTTILRA